MQMREQYLIVSFRKHAVFYLNHQRYFILQKLITQYNLRKKKSIKLHQYLTLRKIAI